MLLGINLPTSLPVERDSKHAGMAPAVGFEPTTNRLTADRSTTELRWITFAPPLERRISCASSSNGQVVLSKAAGRDFDVSPNDSSRLWQRLFRRAMLDCFRARLNGPEAAVAWCLVSFVCGDVSISHLERPPGELSA